MLLRTSSAPVLSSLRNPNLSQVEASKDSSEPPHYVHSPNVSSFHGLASPSVFPARASGDRHGIYGRDDLHLGLTSEIHHIGLSSELEMDRISRPRLLSRAQSEGDLACSSAATAFDNQGILGYDNASSSIHAERTRIASPPTRISSFDMKESILEEVDEPEPPPLQVIHSSYLRAGLHNGSDVLLDPKLLQAFVSDDGELYTTFKLSSSGSPVVCNDKGCRPLTHSECTQFGFLDMASGVGADMHDLSTDFANRGEAYYESLLKSDPGNPLLLSNYAQYLSKRGDLKKSEEYFERAILADPTNGEVLSQYAKLQWDVNRDQDRAEAYYDQAVQAAPDDCYVMASYASFLWDVEENEETSPAAPAVPAYGVTPPASSPLLVHA